MVNWCGHSEDLESVAFGIFAGLFAIQWGTVNK